MNTFKLTADHRQRIASRVKLNLASGANTGADVSQWCGPVFNQLLEGSCSACTTRDYLLWRQNRYGYVPVVDPAVQALYYLGRVILGDVSVDDGNTVHDAFQAPITYGVIPSSDEAYTNETLFTVPPMQDIVFQASNVTDLQPTTANIRASLDGGAPVGIGVTVMNTLFNPTVYNGMHVVDVGTLIQPEEGHAIFVVAYKPDAKYGYLYKFQNSWDTSYGDNGFAWFTEAYLQQCLVEACTLDIPTTKQPLKPIPPLPAYSNNFVLNVGTDKPSYTIGETAAVWVTLTNNGQDLIGQTVMVAIDGISPGPVPIAAAGHNGFPFGPSIPGTYTFTATWENLSKSCSATFTNAPQPTPTPPKPPQPPAPPTPPKPSPTPTPNPSTVVGIDVSRFQGTIDWSKLHGALQFAFVKALDGRSPVDVDFVANYEAAKLNGIIRGAYQLGYPAYETGSQAYTVYKALVNANGGFQLPPTLDVEEATCNGQTPSQITAFVVEWLTDAIADYGHAIFYSDEAFINANIDLSKLPKNALLWVAKYGEKPNLPYTFWQRSNAVTEPGVNVNVDGDVFNGTLAALQSLCVGGDNVQHTKVVVNGHEFDAVVDNNSTYVLWSAFEMIPGFKLSKVNNEFHFDMPVGVDPSKVATAQGYLQKAIDALK